MMAKKRILSWLVAASLALSLLPAAALAADETEPTTPKDAFDQVVDAGDNFLDSNTIATDLGDTTNDMNSVVDRVDAANETAAELEKDLTDTTTEVKVPEFEVETTTDEDGNEKTEIIQNGEAQVVEGKDLDSFMDEKATEANDAAEAGNKLVGEANDLVQDLRDLVNLPDVEGADPQEIANQIRDKAKEANEHYKDAAIAHAEAEYALNAAQEKYDAVIYDAVKDKYTEEAFKALTAEEKAQVAKDVIDQANTELQRAESVLNSAKENLEGLNALYEAAETAKAIAEKYTELADKMASSELTADEFIAAILKQDGWSAGEGNILDKLDVDGIDNGGLADKAVDYALADKNLQTKREDLNTFKESDEAKKAQNTISEIGTAITEARGLIESLINAKPDLVAGSKDEFAQQLTLMSDCLTDLQKAREVLQDPTKTAAEKQAAQQKQNDAMNILFVNDGLSGQWQIDMPLVGRFYTGVQGDGYSAKRWDLDKPNKVNYFYYPQGSVIPKFDQEKYDQDVAAYEKNKSDVKRICELLMGKTATDSTNSVWVKEQEVQNSGYDGKLSDKLKDILVAEEALEDIDLDGALADYLRTIGTDADSSDAAADKAAQLAAVLMGIGKDTLKEAQAAANAAAKKADDAKEALNQAMEDYQKALDRLKEAKVKDDFNADKLKGLLDNAKDKLKAAKTDMDQALRNKIDADKAVDNAEKLLDQLNGGGGTGGTGTTPDTTTGDDDDTTIEDGIVPLAGLIDRQTLVSYLYTHEGSPDGVDAEGEYTLALAWAVANDIVDEEDDPEELVTVAILRDVMTRYAKLLNRTFDVEIPGEDDDIVMNCDEILAEFFGD